MLYRNPIILLDRGLRKGYDWGKCTTEERWVIGEGRLENNGQAIDRRQTNRRFTEAPLQLAPQGVVWGSF